MICPYCKHDETTNDQESFYELTNEIMMEQPCKCWDDSAQIIVYGCPKCGCIFIDV